MTERVRFLDGLRGFLAFVVFIYHFLYSFNADLLFGGDYAAYIGRGMNYKKLISSTPLNLFFNPGFAIHFFFLLSGYVQSFHYFRKPETTVLQKNILKRYFRLAIPTGVVVLLVYFSHRLHLVHRELIPVHPATGDWIKSIMPDSLGFFAALRHGLIDCFIQKASYYQVLWTMPIEIFNSYMVFIVLFATHKTLHRIQLLFMWAAVQFLFLDAYYSVAFSMGMIICYAEVNSVRFRNFFGNKLIKYICLVLGLYLATFPYSGYANTSALTMYKHISFFEKSKSLVPYLMGDLLLLLFLLRAPRLIQLFESKIMLFLGDISFMLYLLHLLIIFTISPLVYAAVLKSSSAQAALWLCFILTTILTLGGSFLLYRFVDIPVLRLCSQFAKKQFGN